MAIYLFCPKKSAGAEELTKLLGANRLKKFDGLHFWDNNLRFGVKEGDTIINWGGGVPELDGVRVLNPWPKKMTKYEELGALAQAGVRTVPVYNRQSGGGNLIPRVNSHSGWSDLLFPPSEGDWYTAKEIYSKECRVHVFARRSIRAGERVVREGFTVSPDWKPGANLAHRWIRTYEGGWKVDYDGFKSTQKLRDISYAAVEALGLTFGAVDIAERTDGILKVVGVNRAPSISGKTIDAYARVITKWLAGKEEEAPVEPDTRRDEESYTIKPVTVKPKRPDFIEWTTTAPTNFTYDTFIKWTNQTNKL